MSDHLRMDDFEIELKNDFLTEAKDLLTQIEDVFLRLETAREDQNIINEIFRIAHNIKGASKAVGFNQLSELTHCAENLILKIKEKEIPVTDEVVTVLLSFKDAVNDMVDKLSSDFDYTANIDDVKAKIQVCLDGKGSSLNAVLPEQVQQEQLLIDPDLHAPVADDAVFSEDIVIAPPENDERFVEDGLSDDVGVNTSLVQPVVQVRESVIPSAPAAVDAVEVASETADRQNSSQVDETIRVKISRINKLNDSVGELAILQNVLNQRRFTYITDPLSNKTISQMMKLFKEVQEISMALRMLPLKQTFQKMSRIVRDTSKTLDKNVNLQLIGEDTEVDKTVLERLSDPLVHLVRNAVDHAMEDKNERLLSKKPETGSIILSANHEGSNLILQVKDDGRGIDHNKIKKKAIDKGILSPEKNLSPQELIQYIFHPGFSTKENVTEVSGRGVGLDVVKTNIESLGGEVRLESEIGRGSVFKIILPLTLAIIDGLVVVSGGNGFVVPLGQITELIRVEKGKLSKFTGGGLFFNLRGDVIPVYNMSEKFGLKSTSEEAAILILLKGQKRTIGILINNVINQQQIVIKKVGDEIKNYPGVMGAAIMGDGKPAFIVDLFEFFNEELMSDSIVDKKQYPADIAI